MIERIFQSVKDLAIKGKSGYFNNAQYNGRINDAQNILFLYYMKKWEVSDQIADSLRPFIKKSDITLTSGVGSVPSDYRHRIEGNYIYIDNSGNSAVERTIPIDFLNSNNKSQTLHSIIRKPSVAEGRIYMDITGSLFAYPKITGDIEFEYLSNPLRLNRTVTVDETTKEEIYAPGDGAFVNLQWATQDETNLLDIMLIFMGLGVRDNDITRFALTQKQLNE